MSLIIVMCVLIVGSGPLRTLSWQSGLKHKIWNDGTLEYIIIKSRMVAT